jgi:preprotein translocase subunit SecG
VAAFARIILTTLGAVLILLVLIQRGRGQGLAGAFGGAGGTSLLGTKAGSFIGKVTAWLAAIWLVLAVVLNIAFNWRRPG